MKTLPPPPDQLTQSTADANSSVAEKDSAQSEKSEKPAKKKKPWSAPVLQFLDEEEETDGRSRAGVVVNPGGAKESTHTREYSEYSPS